jgi:hypothetical protein
MATQLQNEANRRNSLKSTGPKTPEGKAIASRNAVTHGLFARMPVISGENEAEFQAYTEHWLGDLKPVGATEEFLAERIIGIAWRLRRVGQIEANLFQPSESQDTHQLSRLNRYENALERSYYRNVNELRALQKERMAPKPEWYEPEDEEQPASDFDPRHDNPAPVVIEKVSWVFVPAPEPAISPGFSETPPPARPEACV